MTTQATVDVARKTTQVTVDTAMKTVKLGGKAGKSVARSAKSAINFFKPSSKNYSTASPDAEAEKLYQSPSE